MNVSGSLAALYDLVRDVNGALEKGLIGNTGKEELLKTLTKFDTLLNILELDAEEEGVPADILDMANQRQEARKNKDWAKADEMRDQLKALGWEIKDSPDGWDVVKI